MGLFCEASKFFLQDISTVSGGLGHSLQKLVIFFIIGQKWSLTTDVKCLSACRRVRGKTCPGHVEGGSPRPSVPRLVVLVQTLSHVHGRTHDSLHDMSGGWDSAGLRAPGQPEKHIGIPPTPHT